MEQKKKKKYWLIPVCVALLAALLTGVFVLATQEDSGTLSLTLNGDRDIFLQYGDPYIDPGAAAAFAKDDVITDVPVDCIGQVNEKKLGVYLLKYIAQHDGIVRTDYRCVHITDTQLPVITLTVNPDNYTLVGRPYEEEGFIATDNYDGDLTDKFIRKEADGVVTYTVTDSSGNTAVVTRTIQYFDPGYPEIKLVGGNFAFITEGDVYLDPGYTATDPEAGNLTDAVYVRGNIDSSVPGIYKLNYSVTNHYGYTTTKERTVYVIPKQDKETAEPEDPDAPKEPTSGTEIKPNGKVIYLTFDDGPSYHTGRLLDILAKYNVKATFFVVKTSYMDMVTRAANEGHTIAIHTYTHDYSKIYASDDAFMADLTAMQQLIQEKTGQTTMLTRFPGGSSNTISSAYNKGIMTRLTKKLQELGYQYFDWNVSSGDAGGARTAEQVYNNVIKGISGNRNSVVLQHDTHGFTVDAVEKIIIWGLCNGYTFAPLTNESPTCRHPVQN